MLSGYDLRKHLMMVGGREISKKEKKMKKKYVPVPTCPAQTS